MPTTEPKPGMAASNPAATRLMLGTREMILITRNKRNERKAANGPLTGMSAITITAKSKTLQGPRGKFLP